MLKRYASFAHAWERDMLEASRDLVFRNSYADIEYALRALNETGARYEFECYDTSHLYNLAYFLDVGLVAPPLFVQTVFGLMGGIGAHPEDVMHMKRTARPVIWGKAISGQHLERGETNCRWRLRRPQWVGNMRVGLEDSLWIAPGRLASSNAEQVRAAVKNRRGAGIATSNAG